MLRLKVFFIVALILSFSSLCSAAYTWNNATKNVANSTNLSWGLVGLWDFQIDANETLHNVHCNTTATRMTAGGWGNRAYLDFEAGQMIDCDYSSWFVNGGEESEMTWIVVLNGTVDVMMTSAKFGWDAYGATNYGWDYRLIHDTRLANQWSPDAEGTGTSMILSIGSYTSMFTGMFNNTHAIFLINGSSGNKYYSGYGVGTGWDWDGTNRVTVTGAAGSAVKYMLLYNRSLTYEELNDFWKNELYWSDSGTADSCTCAGLNNNWLINMADGCNITTSCELGTGMLNFTGAGACRINASINTSRIAIPPANSILWIADKGIIFIKLIQFLIKKIV